ncbi:MAG: hypothetical protein GX442_07795 [Candidatus Riflebacteria bacterium]|nr:hypothetical protein [Candidatus Riflebacteria bacterium]
MQRTRSAPHRPAASPVLLLPLLLVVLGGTAAAQPLPAEATGPTSVTQAQDGLVLEEGPGGRKFIFSIIDEPDPTSPNPWDRARDIFRSSVRAPVAPVASASSPVAVEKASAEAVIDQPSVRLPVLQGVLTSSDRDTIAILDDQFTRQGDFCAGFEVKKISKNAVVLKREGKEYVLYVKE